MPEVSVETCLLTGQAGVAGKGRETDGRRKDGALFPADLAVAEWQAGGNLYYTFIVRDISERRKREEHVQLLLREVNHRAKNLLSVVQAIASQTIETGGELFITRFSERLRALAANQDLLVRSQWRNIGLKELAQSQLAHFEGFIGERILIDGPELRVTAEAAQTLAMALHELATNAGKYGALSNGAGLVRTSWGVDETGSAARFRFGWVESGGPAVTAPARRGFGAKVITQLPESQLDAEVAYCFPRASGMASFLSGEERVGGGWTGLDGWGAGGRRAKAEAAHSG